MHKKQIKAFLKRKRK